MRPYVLNFITSDGFILNYDQATNTWTDGDLSFDAGLPPEMAPVGADGRRLSGDMGSWSASPVMVAGDALRMLETLRDKTPDNWDHDVVYIWQDDEGECFSEQVSWDQFSRAHVQTTHLPHYDRLITLGVAGLFCWSVEA